MSSRVVYQQRCGSSWLKITISSRISCALSTYCGSISSQHSTHSVEDKESGSTLHSAVKSSVSTLKFKSLAIFIPSAVTNHFWAGLNLVIHFMSRSFQIRSMRISSKMALCLLATLVPSPFLMLRCELMCGFYFLCQKKKKKKCIWIDNNFHFTVRIIRRECEKSSLLSCLWKHGSGAAAFSS